MFRLQYLFYSGPTLVDTITYQYSSLNQLLSETSSTGTDHAFTYDIWSNQIIDSFSTGETRTYTWDAKNQLKSVAVTGSGSNKTIHYTYDAEGSRISKRLQVQNGPDESTKYLTDYNNPTGYSQVLEETASTGLPSASYAWGSDGLLAQRGSGGGGGPPTDELPEAKYAHTDHLGSLRALTGSTGAVVAGSALNFEPFGNLLSGNSAVSSYKFTGQYAESGLNLQYHRARWLSPAKAGWLSQDPVWDFPGNFGNSYSYAGINPLNNKDNSGLFSMGEINISSAIQSITMNIFVPNMVEFTLQAALTATGVDPMMMLAPVFDWVAGAFNLDAIFSEMVQKVGSGVAGMSMGALSDAVMAVAQFISIVQVALDGVIAAFSIVKLFLSKSILNAVDAFNNVRTFLTAFTSYSQTVEVSINPRNKRTMWPELSGPIHHIATNKHHSHWTPLFKELFETAGVSMNSPYNRIPIADHVGPHPKDYHAFVFTRLSGVITRAEKMGLKVIN